MKKLYRKGTVHPSPPPPPSSTNTTISDHFLNLPAAILTLAVALSAEDKEVLAYLLSCSSSTTPFDFDPSKSKKHNSSNKPSNNNNISHATCFTCYCFGCYTSYWARWDASPNRQLIHEIIDAFEDGLLAQRKKKHGVNRRDKKKNSHTNNKNNNNNNNKVLLYGCTNDDNNVTKGLVRANPELGRVGQVEEVCGQGQLGDEGGEKQGSVRKIVSFLGERIWGSVWG